ncbi:carboxymuconolactone decarboxylase family protein [Streptomyces sp. NPDC051561]|uniref:carboxymuconolactone decarboxylase family protein n=1 Tax=Streptomyces sp. NPDC051561 TaxID=3365658 RepID=UPI0037A5630F
MSTSRWRSPVSTAPRNASTASRFSFAETAPRGCGSCLGFHTKDAAAADETALRLHLTATWRESTVFTDAERAALALTEEGSRIADAHHGVSDETWEQVTKHYDDDQIAALVYLVAMINAANRLGVIVRNKGGAYEPGMYAQLSN